MTCFRGGNIWRLVSVMGTSGDSFSWREFQATCVRGAKFRRLVPAGISDDSFSWREVQATWFWQELQTNVSNRNIVNEIY